MRSLHDALDQSSAQGGAAVARTLRDRAWQADVVHEGRAARRRRSTIQTALAAVVALALGLGAAQVLPALLNNEPATETVRLEQIAPLDPGVNAAASDMFSCGVEPQALPGLGTAYADDALQPTLETALVSRHVDAVTGVEVSEPVDLDGTAEVDGNSSFHVVFHVLWGDEAPRGWGVTTRGAILGEDGTVVAPHLGNTEPSSATGTRERRRGLEGGFDEYACGTGGERVAIDGALSLVWIVQVWVDDPGAPIATFVNAGLPDPATFTAVMTGDEPTVTDREAWARERAALLVELEETGASLGDVGIGYRPSARPHTTRFGTGISCTRVMVARDGLAEVRVNPWDQQPTGVEVGMVRVPAEGDGAVDADVAAWGFAHPPHDENPPWSDSPIPATLLIFDASGELVAAREGDAVLWVAGAEAGTPVFFRAFPRPTGCDVPDAVPGPGTYTPVFVYDAFALPGTDELTVPTGDAPPEGWVVLPAMDIDADGGAVAVDLPAGPYTPIMDVGIGPAQAEEEGD